MLFLRSADLKPSDLTLYSQHCRKELSVKRVSRASDSCEVNQSNLR